MTPTGGYAALYEKRDKERRHKAKEARPRQLVIPSSQPQARAHT